MDKITKYANAGGLVAACTCIALLTGLMTVAVICRYVFNAPLLFSDEISGYLLLGSVFFGLGYTMYVGGHIRVEVVLQRLPAKVQKSLTEGLRVVFLLYVLLLLAGTTAVVWSYYTKGTEAFTLLRTPLVWPALVMPIGLIILVLEVIRQISHRSPD